MRAVLFLLVGLLAVLVRAAEPPLVVSPQATGVLRVTGNPEMVAIVARWAAVFQRDHAGVRIEAHLTGSDTGIAALSTARADIALLGRAPTSSEVQAFEWIFRYKPAQVEIMTGSLGHPGHSPALVLFVHRDNPLAQLTLAQVDAIFGTEHRLLPANIRTWGQLGLTGAWADKTIQLYGPDAMSGTGRFFRHAVLNDSRMINWDAFTEFSDTEIPRVATHDAGRQILTALAADRYGLAVANLGFPQPGVRSLALDGILATQDSLIARQYPLTRSVLAYFNRKPGASMDPLVGEFLRYILSAAGQQEVTRAGTYLPLTPKVATEQARRLN